jgi:hypothetical protein
MTASAWCVPARPECLEYPLHDKGDAARGRIAAEGKR